MASEVFSAREGGVNPLNAVSNGLMSRAYRAGSRPTTSKKSYEESEWRSAAGDALNGLPFMKNSRGEVPLGAARILSDDHYVRYDRNNVTGNSYSGYVVNVRDKNGKLVEVRRPATATRLNKAMQAIVKKYKK